MDSYLDHSGVHPHALWRHELLQIAKQRIRRWFESVGILDANVFDAADSSFLTIRMVTPYLREGIVVTTWHYDGEDEYIVIHKCGINLDEKEAQKVISLLDATWGELPKLIVCGFLKVKEIPPTLIDPKYNEPGFDLEADIVRLLGE